ncbi:MAG: TonB-dependent receptor [Bacteroidales bacterium]|nr:TonB-dependent receptor [Bacteroidales bacterium]
MRLITILIFLTSLFCSEVLSAQQAPAEIKYTVSGNVSDENTGEELLGASIYIKELESGSATNIYGFYSISLPEGNYTFIYSYIGYESVEKSIDLNQDITINIELIPKTEILSEAVITGERKNEEITKAEMSTMKINYKTIKQIPALFGEVDIIKAIQLLPGVQSTSEGGSGFSVRGGSPDQNLILLDEATVYNASHLLGFFSVFNNDAIKDVKIYKGDIPASSGGRISSLLDVRMKDGNSKKFSGTGGIGIISSRLTLEGPIIKDRTSFIVSGRRTYADIFLPIFANNEMKESRLYFYDFNAKINHRINDKNRIYASGYFGRDVFKNKFAEMTMGNQIFTIRWNHLFSKKLFSNVTFIHSKYDYDLGTAEGEAHSFIWKSRMLDHSAKVDLSYYPDAYNTVKFGASTIFHDFDPGSAKGVGEQSMFNEYSVPKNYALESGVYISNEQKLGSRLTLKYGLRFSIFNNIGKGTIYNYEDDYIAIDSTVYKNGEFFNTYSGLEPRVGMTYVLNEASSVKASYSRTKQYIHLAQNSTAGTPFDLWFPSSPNVKPQIGDQIAAGYFRNFKENKFETSVEVYYKFMNNNIDFKDHAELLLNPKLEGELRFGKGQAYGIEFLLKIPDGKINGWISYTLSKTTRKIPEINNGMTYSAPYDKPNDISVVINYVIDERKILSVNWVYATGSPVTFPTGRAEYGGKIVPIYSERNSYRMPDYHRMDISFTIKGKKKAGKSFSHDWNFSVYNLYGRKNAWAINFVQDPTNPNLTYAEMTYLFSIVPSITYNFKF